MRLKQIAWFAGSWIASVGALAIIAFAIRLMVLS
jgi:hypothetical protein